MTSCCWCPSGSVVGTAAYRHDACCQSAACSVARVQVCPNKQHVVAGCRLKRLYVDSKACTETMVDHTAHAGRLACDLAGLVAVEALDMKSLR